MSFRPPNQRSNEPGPDDEPAALESRAPLNARRRRQDVESAYLAEAVELGRLPHDEHEICATISGGVVGIDVVARGPRRKRRATTRQLLASIEDETALVEANTLLLTEALAALGTGTRRWSAGVDPFVAITLDSRFIATESFLTCIKETTRAAGLEPDQLLLSVEADLGLASSWPSLQRLKSHGVRVAMESFRLGPPANDLVSRFPLDVLRVDLSELARAEDRDPRGELRSIVRLAQDLRCQVMAEHITSRELLDVATEAGCDLIVVPPADGAG